MFEQFFGDLGWQIGIAVIVYLLGVGTTWIWHELFGDVFEERMQKNVQLAVDIIYESEKKFPGKNRGMDKLTYSTKQLMIRSGMKDYGKAQEYILKVFNLTRLNKLF